MKRLYRQTTLALALLSALSSFAQSSAPHPSFGSVQTPVIPGERLSAWLSRNTPLAADTTALHWQVPAERAAQERLRQAVIHSLPDGALHEKLLLLPVTGRLTLAHTEVRALQATPSQDPELQDGQHVILFSRPRYIAVLGADGEVCHVPHQAGALALDYLRACRGADRAEQVDTVWLAQPDGRTQQFGIAPWNSGAQDEPGPGAWIWAPERTSHIDANVSDNLIRFLATQFPAEYIWPDSSKQSQAPVATPPDAAPRNAQVTASDWGEIGLLQTPTARMAPVGSMRFHMSQVEPYTRGTVMFQPLDWFEAGFRYTDVSNRLYGAADFSGDQTYKDKSIDFKVRLVQEDARWPQLAIGLRDAGGTGLFSSEYLVANKRWGHWDASLGLAWGNMGARGNVENPLSLLDDAFTTRPAAQSALGGTANTQSFFRGSAALFGGVQWQTPSSPWLLKFELDGNHYQNEPQLNNQESSSPFNIGAVYRFSPHIDLSMGFERGNKLMFGFTLHEQLGTIKSPKLLDPPLPAVQAMRPVSLSANGWAAASEALALHTGWSVRSIRQQHAATTVVAEVDKAVHLQERIDRAVTVLHQYEPAESNQFVLQLHERGLPMIRVEIDRAEWVAQRTQAIEPAMRLPVQQVMPSAAVTRTATDWQGRPAGFKTDWSPSFSYVLGGPDNFLLYQLGVQANLEQRFTDNTWLSANVNYRLLDNYAGYKVNAPGYLPPVRTLMREFVTTSRVNMPNFQLTTVQELGGSHYISAYAGMLEFMYGGVGAEWLYRPWHSPVAVGVDVNHVRQRGFKQDFEFRDYRVNTGHATLYWDTGWNDLHVKLSAGQYLAGDVGATLDIRRSFSNGVTLGAWATKTNVSEEQFGEGSFDKGIYINIPFDVMLPISTESSSTVMWVPLSRDGGSKLGRRYSLFDFTRQRDRRSLQWASIKEATPQTAEDRSYILKASPRNALQRLGETTTNLGQQIAHVPSSTWLLAGGTILASSLLDNAVDSRISSTANADGTYPKSAASNIPYALALGAGLLYTGMGGDSAATTAETSLTAAAYTLGTNLATRYVVGRSRPLDDKGAGDFHGFTSQAVNSGFASNHVAMAFALATPFAQQYDMPWLYGAAALTAVGRMQQREHWMSDTVAGAFMGYAIGSLMSEQQQGRKNGVRIMATPQSVAATWSF